MAVSFIINRIQACSSMEQVGAVVDYLSDEGVGYIVNSSREDRALIFDAVASKSTSILEAQLRIYRQTHV